jgi:hypothetical protein
MNLANVRFSPRHGRRIGQVEIASISWPEDRATVIVLRNLDLRHEKKGWSEGLLQPVSL